TSHAPRHDMTNEQKVGLFFIVGIVLVLVMIEVIAGTGLLHKGYSLHVDYPTVEGLRSGDAVQVAGVKLGRVDDIELKPDGVRVELWLDARAVVHRNAVARLDYQALSGTRFVSISLGEASTGRLSDGDALTGEIAPGITQMVGELQTVAHSVQDLAESLNE